MPPVIGRREWVAALGGFVITWSVRASAQPSSVPVIAVVRIGKRGTGLHLEDAFRQGLREVGYIEDQNAAIEWRYAEEDYERLPRIMADLVDRRVAVITAPGAIASALAAKAATQTIPIVFEMGADPVDFGLVESFAHPGGNLTGVYELQTKYVAKRLELLHQLIPTAAKIALLTNPANPFSRIESREAEAAARSLGLELHVANAINQNEIELTFPYLIALGARAIMIGANAVFFSQRSQIAALAARYVIPAMGPWREYPAAGGLMSYGTSQSDAYRLAGTYVGRILKGEKPADMPVQQPTKFEFVINLKTAKVLDLAIPDKLLVLVDELIE